MGREKGMAWDLLFWSLLIIFGSFSSGYTLYKLSMKKEQQKKEQQKKDT